MSRALSVVAAFMQAFLFFTYGGRGTRDRAHSVFVQLQRVAKIERWNSITPATLTLHQTRKFLAIRAGEGVTLATLENEASAIRRALKGAGRGDELKLFTREKLGLPSRPRKGKGVAVDDAVLAAAIAFAMPRTAAMLQVQRALGLRINEVIECRDSLLDWEKSLREGGTHVELRHGSKGGRPRHIYIHPEHRAAAHAAVLRLLLATNGGKTYPIAEAPNGDRAARIHNSDLANLGLKGEKSSHALRRKFALDQYRAYLAQGCHPRQALGRVACDLGHGEGRGRWVLNNYLSNSLSHEELAAIPGRGQRS